MHVVMIDVLIKNQSQVPLAGDQHPVQELAPGAGDPAFRDRARRLDRRLDDPDPGCREHGVERVGELGVRVPDQELQPVGMSSRFISRLGLLGQPFPVGCAVIPACPQTPISRERDHLAIMMSVSGKDRPGYLYCTQPRTQPPATQADQLGG
jgi:hypothetical protein